MRASGLLKLALAFSMSMNVAALVAAGYRHACNARSCAVEDGSGDARPPIEQLALSSEQRERFEGLRDEFLAHRDACHAGMVALRQQLLDELLREAPDRARIDALVDEMSTRQAELQRALVAHLVAEKAVLRDEQLPAFRRILERHVVGGHGPLHGPGALRERP